jgi:hypothetical protein
VHQLRPGVRHVRVRHPFHERSQASDPEIVKSNFTLRCLYTQPKDNPCYPGIRNRLADAQGDVYRVSKTALTGIEASPRHFPERATSSTLSRPVTRQAPWTGLST